MAREGPCCHCLKKDSNLWRRGPPEKPSLCNACGLRWLTKGTLKGYVPNHEGPRSKASKKRTEGTWHTGFPKRKRSVPPFPIEKFKRKLLDMLPKPKCSQPTSEQEIELLYCNNHNFDGEIGLGCILMSTDTSEKRTVKRPCP